jgi:DNA repair exonuclease SbcCD ATPase subunit
MRVDYLALVVALVNTKLETLCQEIGNGDLMINLDFKGHRTQKIDIVVSGALGGYDAMSDGQRRYVDFIIQLALYQLQSKEDIPYLVLDEVFGEVDNTRLGHILEYLGKWSDGKFPIYVVTHNEHAKSFLAGQLTFHRTGGVTTLQVAA